jgi:hypothetical protein
MSLTVAAHLSFNAVEAQTIVLAYIKSSSAPSE